MYDFIFYNKFQLSKSSQTQVFVLKRRPHVIALGGESMSALGIMREVSDLMKSLHDMGELSQPIQVVDS